MATPSPPGLVTTATAASTSPPAANTSGRSSRLRGLSYLLQNHLLSRDSASQSASPTLSTHQQHRSTDESSASLRSPTLSSGGRKSGRRTNSTHNIYEPANPRSDSGNESANSNPPLRRTVTAQGLTGSHSETVTSPGLPLDADADGTTTTNAARETASKGEDATDATAMTRSRSATTGDASLDALPSIRLTAYYDSRSARQSLTFSPVARTLPTGSEIIKVGRYSERENHAAVPANTPSAAPVGFKSKVVSRRHCEFWYESGKWFIKDVKSSSGTFLNHIRLSPPGQESRPFPVNDGDIVQLGIDFRGGEEMIFRCVKMRVELNRGWQAKLNNFNMAAHKRLRNMNASSTATPGTAGPQAQDCSICLNAIAPCQSLFVAPCSHTWHYKCIRELLIGPSWPIFTCPNCRAAADLDADVEEPSEDWQQYDEDEDSVEEKADDAAPQSEGAKNGGSEDQPLGQRDQTETESGDATMMDSTMIVNASPSGNATSNPVAIPNATPRQNPTVDTSARALKTPSPNDTPLVPSNEGPITPRNDAGPWVFDGDAGRSSQDVSRRPGMTSLDAAAQGQTNGA